MAKGSGTTRASGSRNLGGISNQVNRLTRYETEKVNAVYDAFRVQTNEYSNPDLMEIRETSMGNWRLYYADHDTGTTISKQVISKYIARKAGLLK